MFFYFVVKASTVGTEDGWKDV